MSPAAALSDHRIVWTFDTDTIRAAAVCDAQTDAICRLECAEGCEAIQFIAADVDGSPQHLVHDDFDEQAAPKAHRLIDSGSCNFVDWLNADPGVIAELCHKPTSFEVGHTYIAPVWDNDGAEWLPLVPGSEPTEGDGE